MPPILSINSVSSSVVRGDSGSSKRKAHFAGIDALRGYAAIAVVLLHACVPYARPSMAGLSWSVCSEASSGLVTWLFWAIEVVIMPIFLVIAGFFAARSFASHGAWATTKARARRLGSPFLLAAICLLPFEFYIWMLGWIAEGQVTLGEVRRLKFAGGVDCNLWGLAHLWFLPYLISYAALLGLAWSSIRRFSADRIMRLALPGCFLIAVVSMMLRPEIVWGFQHAFLPVPSKWIYSGAFFAAGGFWFLVDPDLSGLAGQGKRMLGPAILLLVAAVGTGIWWLGAIGEPVQWMHGGWAEYKPTTSSHSLASNVSAAGLSIAGLPVAGAFVRLSVAVLTAAAAAVMAFALMGISLSRVSRLGPITQSLANASFVIYLLHHPVVGLAHITARFSMPGVSPIAKVAIVTGLGVAAGWSTSWLWSRYRQRVWEAPSAGEQIRDEEIRLLQFPRPSDAAASKVA